jgi:hypothetical protein
VEVRGYLQVETESGDAANEAVEEWIVAVARGETPPPGVTVRWLRIEPQSDEHIGWPPPNNVA